MTAQPMSVRLPENESLETAGVKLHGGEKIIFPVTLWNVEYVIVLNKPPFHGELGITFPGFIARNGKRIPCKLGMKDNLSALWVDGPLPS